ncbi:hypothetical protein KQH50_00680 [bacterium]|nr:hypothetical protein [bacterium]
MNRQIKPRILLLALLIAGLIIGCSPQSPDADLPSDKTTTTNAEDTAIPTENEKVTDCPGDEINPLGQSIAEDYDFTDYDQVMTWFCEGAEFEDILVALETEALTDEPAGDMLQMLADGLNWDEIWLLVGLAD